MIRHETWRPVVGFPDQYLVSDAGRVKRLAVQFVRKNGWKYNLPEKIRTPGTLPSGHKYILLRKYGSGISKPRLVHHLVLEAFVGLCPPGMECCHNNGDPTDNRLSNLRWDTHLNNEKDKRGHGTRPHGSKHWRAILTEEDVRKMRSMYQSGKYSKIALARLFGTSIWNVYPILKRQTWVHI